MQKHEKTKGTVDFLRTELQTARTFIAIARQAKFEQKVLHNLVNARKACTSTRHFLDHVQLTEDEVAEIKGQLESIENELAALEASVRLTDHSSNKSSSQASS